jgi:hypothetical protein
VCEDRLVICRDLATDTCFDDGWRRLYLSLGIHSVQSARAGLKNLNEAISGVSA